MLFISIERLAGLLLLAHVALSARWIPDFPELVNKGNESTVGDEVGKSEHSGINSSFSALLNINNHLGGPGGLGRCGYGDKDVWDAASRGPPQRIAEELRRSRKMGFTTAIGFANRVIQLGRIALSTQVFMFRLPAVEAQDVIKAQYGILTAKVSETCFVFLTEHLQNWNRSCFHEVRRGRKTLLANLNTKCNITDEQDNLYYLHYGYWTVYEPLTDKNASMIAVRSIDERRFEARNDSLRQIWYLGQKYLAFRTSAFLSQQYTHARSKQDVKRLTADIFTLNNLLTMNSARLEAVELDALGNCVSAQADSIASILQALGTSASATYRVTLLFRERSWPHFAYSGWHLIRHPIYSYRKWRLRRADQWDNEGIGGKLGVIFGPLLRLASLYFTVYALAAIRIHAPFAVLIAGEVATFVHVFREDLLPVLVTFMLNRLWSSTRSAVLMYEVQKGMNDNSPHLVRGLRRSLGVLGGCAAIKATRQKMHTEVDRIVSHPEFVRQLKIYGATYGDEKADELEQELRRYVEGVVVAAFTDELSPAIVRLVEDQVRRKNPNFGWLPWQSWEKHRVDNIRNAILNKSIRYVGPQDLGWRGEAKVVQIVWKLKSKPRQVDGIKGMWNRSKLLLVESGKDMFSISLGVDPQGLTVAPETGPSSGQNVSLSLSKENKNRLEVRDTQAYYKSQGSWLRWDDWKMYRGFRLNRFLIKRRIWFDLSLGCEKPSNDCLNLISSKNQSLPVRWKKRYYRKPSRVYLKLSRDHRGDCKQQGFALTGQVKKCLWVQDEIAHLKWERDHLKREKQTTWATGNLDASKTIMDEILETLRQSSNESVASLANDILHQRLGVRSVQLMREEIDQEGAAMADESGRDEQERRELRAVENQANVAFLHELKSHPDAYRDVVNGESE